MKLWIDAIRPAPEGYTWIKTVREAIAAITVSEGLEGEAKYTNSELQGQFKIELIDMDHDSGRFWPPGYIYLLYWLEHTGRSYPIRIHSMNPVGVANMRTIIQRNNWKEVL